MPHEVPTHEPTELRAGDDWEWDISFAHFLPSEGWQLSYALRGETDFVTAWGTHVTANGETFEVRVPASATAGLKSGAYRLFRIFTDGTKRRTTLLDESFQLLADPDAEVNAKSFNRRMLEAIEARLEAWAPGVEIDSFSVNGRSVTYRNREELVSARDHYRILVQLETNPDARLQHAARFVRA